MPPIIQRMALLKMAARMSKTMPAVINVCLPCSGYSSGPTLWASWPGLQPKLQPSGHARLTLRGAARTRFPCTRDKPQHSGYRDDTALPDDDERGREVRFGLLNGRAPRPKRQPSGGSGFTPSFAMAAWPSGNPRTAPTRCSLATRSAAPPGRNTARRSWRSNTRVNPCRTSGTSVGLVGVRIGKARAALSVSGVL
jgi:hypothetical protein